jgi:hypothetical protein
MARAGKEGARHFERASADRLLARPNIVNMGFKGFAENKIGTELDRVLTMTFPRIPMWLAANGDSRMPTKTPSFILPIS